MNAQKQFRRTLFSCVVNRRHIAAGLVISISLLCLTFCIPLQSRSVPLEAVCKVYDLDRCDELQEPTSSELSVPSGNGNEYGKTDSKSQASQLGEANPLSTTPIRTTKPVYREDKDAGMIEAIRAAAPEQHFTEASFKRIPGSEIDVLVQCEEFPEWGYNILCGNSHNAFIDWTGGAWNWKDWEFINPAGGGHYDYGGNEVYQANLEINGSALSVKWTRPIDPHPLVDGDCGKPISGPVSSHTYAGPLYIEKHDEYFHATTGGFPGVAKCIDRNVSKIEGQGGWVFNGDWRKVYDLADYGIAYPDACYVRNLDVIYLRTHGASSSYYIYPNENYRMKLLSSGWHINDSGFFDSATDQANNICYQYYPQVGIWGYKLTADSVSGGIEPEKVFASQSSTLSIPSLSVEHSTGNLVAVGVDGFALHINTQTGEELDISGEGGMQSPTSTGKYIYGKFDMIEKIPCVGIGMADAREGVFLMTLPANVCSMARVLEPPTDPIEPPPIDPIPPDVSIDDVDLSGVGGWSTGLALPKGNAFSATTQFDCRKDWSDGSCKFGVLSGNTEGSNAPQLDVSGISLQVGDSLVKPDTAFWSESGEYMAERHYRVLSGDLLVIFYVRQYSGARHVIVSVENGFLNKVTPALDYEAVVTVGETSQAHQVYHERNTRWVADIWDGQHADARQSTYSLIASGLVPPYTISPKASPGTYQSYLPMGIGNHTLRMANSGFQRQIGLLPGWDANYIANPSESAYNSVIANAYAIGTYGIVWRDIDTLDIVEPSKFPRWSVSGDSKGGVGAINRGDTSWERAHFPSTGYLAYLLTGQQVHLDTLGHTAATCYLVQSFSYGGGEGEQRLDLGEIRGQAWCLRSGGMYAAMTGDNGLSRRLAFNMKHWADLGAPNELGLTYLYGSYGVPGVTAPWMHNFRVASIGFLSDIEPVSNMTDLVHFRDFGYKWPVGLLRERQWCHAGKYTYKVGNVEKVDGLYKWSEMPDLGPCKNQMLDTPESTDYWANLLPAISYARKHGALGAKAAWDRVSGASNFDAWIKRFKSNAVWGVIHE